MGLPVCTGEHSSRQPCYGWDQTKVNRSYGGNPIRSNHPESLNFGWAPGAEETIRRNRQIAIGCVTHAGRRNAKGPHAVHELHRDPADPIVAATARLCPDPPSTCDSKILAPSGRNRSADGPGFRIIEKPAHAKTQRRKGVMTVAIDRHNASLPRVNAHYIMITIRCLMNGYPSVPM